MSYKISVIVPVYKVEEYLDRCINSILNQTFKKFELILVDDGSPDKCGLICDKYAQKDSRIKVIHKDNEGLSAARNSGIEIAKGEYIAFVDSDDYIDKRMYEELYNVAINNKSDIVICDYQKIYSNNESDNCKSVNTYKVENLSKTQALSRLYDADSSAYIVAWNKLYKKSLFDKLRYPIGRLYEDEFITYKLLYYSNNITYLPLKLYYYMQREGSITSSKKESKERLDVIVAFKERLEFIYENDINYLGKETAQKYIYYLFSIYYNIKDNYKDSSDKLYLLRKDYKKILHIVLRYIDCTWKEKIALIVFAVNPYLHELLYRMKSYIL